MNLNRCMFAGRLVRDIELRFLPSGQAVAAISLAINRRWKNAQGETQEEVAFLDFEAFGKTAEVMNQYLKKGSSVFIESRAKLDVWKDKDGNNRSKVKFVVESFEFLDSRREESEPVAPGKPNPNMSNFPKSGGTKMRMPEPVDEEPSF